MVGASPFPLWLGVEYEDLGRLTMVVNLRIVDTLLGPEQQGLLRLDSIGYHFYIYRGFSVFLL